MQSLRTSQRIDTDSREAYKKLSNYHEHVLFFKDILDNLRSCATKGNLIESMLFVACEFLLVKRICIVVSNLYEMITFSCCRAGNIIIPEH